MAAFALIAGIVFGAVSTDGASDRFIYGLKVFAKFMGVGLLLGWLLYYLPF
jgi:hypothetical protein